MEETPQTPQPTPAPTTQPPAPQPVQTPAIEPTTASPSHKMLLAGTLFLIVLLAGVGFVYMNSQKKIADSTATEGAVGKSPTTEPVTTITIKEEEDVSAIDVGDIEDDFVEVNADVDKL